MVSKVVSPQEVSEMSKGYPDLNNEKILFREAINCLKDANMISEKTFLGVYEATKWAEEAKGTLWFSVEELESFEILMKARLRQLYSWLSATVSSERSHSEWCSNKIELELLNRAIDVLKSKPEKKESMTILAHPGEVHKHGEE